MPELKRNEVLSFDDGLLTVRMSGHDTENGWATLAFHERQGTLDADGFHHFELPPSELRALRDFLNRVVPPDKPSKLWAETTTVRCCSAASPCNHQKKWPGTVCETCYLATTPLLHKDQQAAAKEWTGPVLKTQR